MLDDLIAERRKKLELLRKAGADPYPATVERSMGAGEARTNFAKLLRAKKSFTLAGRVTGVRKQGALMFIDLTDESGKMQILAKREGLKNFELLRDALDIGDFLEATGVPFKTKSGEPTIEAKSARVITKSLRPLPSEWHGLKDVESRLRQRYIDILMNPEVHELFVKKARYWNTFREELAKAGFLEVETPVLEAIPGGAEAEPFITHHNALDINLYLRISLELPLKRLLVAGYEKVFEIGRIFRNEGIDAEHLQDYTQLEFYWAYADYEELMQFVEKLYRTVLKATFGSLTHIWEGTKIDWGKKWPRLEYYDLFKQYVKLDLEKATPGELREKAVAENLKPEPGLGRGRLIDLLLKKRVRPHLVQPAFLVNPPVEIEPLAKRLPHAPHKVARMQVVACGTELGKGFSELNDPTDQRKRFEEQMALREKGDKEAQRLDEDFLIALEHGMPPAAGFGVSERLFAIVAGLPVRETVIFPLMRPLKGK
jgi:lysyl-tRNA synthetase class 2